MNLIQFKQIEGLETSLTDANALTTGVSGLLRGQILDILTGDSTFSGDKIFANSVTFYEPVTGVSSGNFQGGLWVGADKVLTAADTGSVFVTLIGDQNITGVKTFQGGEENTNFRGGVVSLLPWGSPGEPVPQLRVTGELWITGSDGSPVQVVNSGTPAPVEGGVQINSGDNFAASDQFMWDGATLIVGGTISGENFISTGTWNTTGNGIKYTGGNVGIGDMTGDMDALLHLQGGAPDIRLTDSAGAGSGTSFEIKYDNSSLTVKDADAAASLLNLSGSSISITTDSNPLYQGLLHISGGDVYINDGSLYISGQAVLPGGGTTTGIISGGTITSTGIISGGSTIITTGTVEGGTVTGTSGLFETLWITGSDGSWIQITGAGGGGGGGGGSCDCTGSLTTTGIISGGSITTTGIISGGSTIITTGSVEGGTITSTGMISGGSTIVTTGTLQGGTVTGTSGLFENLWITGSDGSWIQITGAGGGGGGGGITINSGVSFQTALTSGVSSQTITFPEALSAVPQVACTIVNSGNGGIIPFSISGTTNSQYVVDFTDAIPNDDYAINTLIGGGNFTSSGGGSCDCTGSITTTGIISGGSVTTTGIISGGSTIITTGTVEGATVTGTSGLFETLWITGSDGSWIQITGAGGGGGGGSCDCTGSITTTGIISGGSVTTTGIISGGSTIITTGSVEGGTITSTGMISGGSTIITTGAVEGGTITSTGIISGGSTIITTGTLQGGTVTGTSGLFENLWITGSDGSWIQITGAGGGGGGGGITINSGVSFQTALTSGVSTQTITFPEALSAVPQVACTIVNSGNGGIIPFSISGTTNSQYVVDFTDAIPNDDYAINTLIGGGNFTTTGGTVWATGGGGTIYYTDGNVGIGTESPSSALHVDGQIIAENSILARRSFSGDPSQAATSAILNVVDTTLTGDHKNRLTVLGNGKVGIGGTDPTTQLTVAVTGNDDGILITGDLGGSIARLYQDGTTANGRLVLYKNTKPWASFNDGGTSISGCTLSYGFTNEFFNRTAEWGATLGVQCSGIGATGLRVMNVAHTQNVFSVTNEGAVAINQKGFLEWDVGADSLSLSASGGAPARSFLVHSGGGVVLPRLTNDEMSSISGPTDGEMIYNTSENAFYGYENGVWVNLRS